MNGSVFFAVTQLGSVGVGVGVGFGSHACEPHKQTCWEESALKGSHSFRNAQTGDTGVLEKDGGSDDKASERLAWPWLKLEHQTRTGSFHCFKYSVF